MKTIGMVGGTGWLSTLEYYRKMNEEVHRRLGGHNAARCILYSLNFADVVRLKESDPDQVAVGQLVVETAVKLYAAGADGLLLCANTFHWFAEAVEKSVPVPLIHIATATAREIRAHHLAKVGLLGTRPTMERDFYVKKLREGGVEAIVPGPEERQFIDDAIMNELVRGVFRAEVKARFLEIMDSLARRGAQGVVMGCTEIPLLIQQSDTELPLFDTLAIHVEAAVDFALTE